MMLGQGLTKDAAEWQPVTVLRGLTGCRGLVEEGATQTSCEEEVNERAPAAFEKYNNGLSGATLDALRRLDALRIPGDAPP